ncbi:hypothetical protein NQ317_003459 [Molorchus minor]|uniref:Multidrug resistance-associated protein lethal(2)03659 n=1 Tax=Molorchus minor TaxID=1323400 RepID=A0ABQ9K0W3_9CUCU|nr:hypothetical protein NQ317_003459 [Molorchus minor]
MYAPLKSHESARLGDRLEAEWNYQLAHKKDPSLLIAIAKVFGMELIIYGIFNIFIELVIRLSQPLLISKLLEYYEPNQTKMKIGDAYMYAGLIVLATLINVLCIHNYQLRVMHLGMKVRVATCSLVYRKALKLSKTALAETTIGQMVNLLSNDVSRFDFAGQHIHNLWLAPVATVIVMYLVYAYVGTTGLIGSFFLLLFIPFQMYMGKKTSQYRLRTAIRTDERVRLMNEIISGIQVIKMYTWEKPFAKLVELTRRNSTNSQNIHNSSHNDVLQLGFEYSGNILVYNHLRFNRKYNYCFIRLHIIGILRNFENVGNDVLPSSDNPIFAETQVSIKRIKEFLLYDEVQPKKEFDGLLIDEKSIMEKGNGVNGYKEQIGIHLNNTSVKWINSFPENVLDNITFSASSNQLVAVVGQVGSGKTTLLHTILKELPPTKGSINVEGKISYASQEPWLFGGSVRQNILFGQEFDANKYNEVIRVCALERDFFLFPYGDRTLVGARGARAVYKDADIYLLDDPLSAVDTYVGRRLFEDCICGYLKAKCVVLVTHQLQYLKNVDTIYMLSDGKVERSGSYSELRAADNEFTKLLSDIEEDEEKAEQRRKSKIKDGTEDKNETEDIPTQEMEERSSGTVSGKVYKSYMLAGGGWLKTALLFSAFVISQITASLTDYFVSIWSNLEQWRLENGKMITKNDLNSDKPPVINMEGTQWTLNEIITEEVAIYLYSFLVIITMVLSITRSIAFFRYCMTASTRLHNTMFYKIVYATMRFFNTNPPGRILNRFSKDIGGIDETLPITIIDTMQIGMTVVAITMVIGSLNPWILIPTVIILTIFYFMRLVFLATSRDVKRIEGVTRSPIYTHLSASLQGLTTIRAFGAQERLTSEFDNFQDQYSAAYFMFLGANRSFGFWLDAHCVIYIALVTVSIFFIESEVFGGNVGLALTQSMGLTGMFQWGMRQWSELENQMTSVERVQEYVDVTPEANENTKDPPKNWPETGNVIFDKLCLRYDPDEPYILKYLSFEVKGQEKIGIVGRTGAGKSSLIAALFRLADIDGKILIDNVNTKEIALNVLRSKISIIPQEPVLFSGTLRKNLDPFDEYDDEILWKALDEVELKNALSELPSGLDSKMSEGGSNFSVGQRQLVCLARAIIRNNKILVLDEATANIDPHTDALIQATIRNKFADCTVLTIAHRLHTIMDSDKVLIMDAGQVAEFDHPHILLQNTEGVFSKLVYQTGKAMAENLTLIAKQNYDKLSQQ